MSQENFAYGFTSRYNMHNRVSLLFLDACYRAEDKELAAKVLKSVKTDLQQQMKYYNSLSGRNAEGMADERRSAENYLQGIEQMEQMYKAKATATETGKVLGADTNKAPVKK